MRNGIMLRVEGISVEYEKRIVVAGVSFEMRSGDLIALLGPNGAGKSSLFRAINGTVPLAAGRIMLGGREIRELPRREIARRIAVVAQENETKFPVTVMEFVLSGRFAHGGAFGWETEDDIAAARDAIEKCELAEFSERPMNQLSGGERQRVVLARALAAQTELMLLDEPTANLDIAHQALMLRLVREKCSAGAAAAVVTHDINLAAEFASKVILLNDGGMFAYGPPREVLTAGNLEEVFGVSVVLDENPVSGKLRVTTVY